MRANRLHGCFLSMLLLFWLAAMPHVLAQETHAPDATSDAAADPAAEAGQGTLLVEPEAERLDGLFADLKRESDPRAARRIVADIWAEWNDSGSATVNLLMQWANDAIGDDRHGTALDFLDQAIVLEPDYVEGWNRRATLHYMMGSHGKSMSDIHRVLELEPRHFGALAGMAAIFSEAGNDRLALRAFRRSLEVYPADRATQRRVGELEEDLAGDPV